MRRYPLVIVSGILLVIFLIGYYLRNPLVTRVSINEHVIPVELAVTNEEKQRGLGYRDSLNADSGMLFVYDHPEQYGFWMKEMRFPIDIIWIADNLVVDISHNVPVATTSTPPSYQAKIPVNKVLEVNAGKAREWGIDIGDLVQILR
jgi:uncharacterized membrane protein (UPF0127 family)